MTGSGLRPFRPDGASAIRPSHAEHFATDRIDALSALDAIRQQLARSDGHRTPPVQVMLDGYVQHHVTMIPIASVVALVFVVLGVSCWRRFARTRGPARRLFGALSAVVLLLMITEAVANVTTVADPLPKFLALFQGGW